ncbi:hypothetical protein E4U39_007555, partial [Claviceps sp. Clav50 group G5]
GERSAGGEEKRSTTVRRIPAAACHDEFDALQNPTGTLPTSDPQVRNLKISESAIASTGNGIGLSPEDLEFELGLGEQQLFTDLGKSVYLHLVVALGRWRCQWSLRIVRGFFWSIRDDAMKWNEAGRPKAWI